MHLLILGCGDIGTRVGLSILQQGWRVSAVRRRPQLLPDDFDRIALDLTEADGFSELYQVNPDYVLVTPTPPSYDPAGYQSGFAGVAQALAGQEWVARCRRVFWVSSTRVYREAGGGWVDEHSALNLDEPQAAAMVAAEASVRRGATATIIRPAGVYGNPEGMLMRRVKAGEGGGTAAPYGNRIHRDDLSRLIVHCLIRDLNGESVPPTLVGADHDTTPTHEIEDWLAGQLGLTLKRPAEGGPVRANRRCANELLGQIGFRLDYPTWREGYQDSLALSAENV